MPTSCCTDTAVYTFWAGVVCALPPLLLWLEGSGDSGRALTGCETLLVEENQMNPTGGTAVVAVVVTCHERAREVTTTVRSRTKDKYVHIPG